MENASKALIIAGAILIAILLIGIGVGLISAVSDPAAQGTDEIVQAGIKAANAKFEKYEGKKSGSDVLALLKEIRINNSSNTTTTGNIILFTATGWKLQDGTTVGGTLKNKTASPLDGIANLEQNVVKSHIYTVSFSYDANNARISLITIKY